MTLLLSVPVSVMAQTDGEVLQKQFGKQEIKIDATEEIAFYDFMGDEPIKGDIQNNSQSLTVFRPASEGYAIQIIFSNIDLQSHSEQCPNYLNIYDGVADADKSFVFADGPYDITLENCGLPLGENVRIEGNYKNYTYTSASDDGVLSIAHVCRMVMTCEGWTAKVRCVPVGEMKINNAGTTGNGINQVPACKYDIPFISFYVDAEGTYNADKVKSFTFKVLENETAADVMQCAVYRGGAENFDIYHKTDAVISSLGGGNYKFTLSEPLQSGRNVFTVVGSFKDESKVNSRFSTEGVEIVTEKHPDGVAAFNNSGAITLLVPPVEYMREGHTTIGIGDIPITFYDNGGPGKMSPISEGVTTFVPEKKGFKVSIDFKDVKLYKTAYTDKNEEIRIYDGSSVDERYLIKVLTETNTATVNSTADDGALTIVYRDNGANPYYKEDGFEAVVSSFSPTEMICTGIDAELLGGCVNGGEKEAAVMQMVIRTKNTEPALKARSFGFVTNNTYKCINSATLYYCGREVKPDNSINIGTVGVKGDTFTITADKDIDMIEGDNYFMLVYDINPEVKDGENISASVTNVTLSGKNYDVVNNTEKNIVVDNVIYSEEGRHEVVVSGRKSFKTRMHSYGETHMPGTENQMITFYPAHEGMKMQIDFKDFNLYYSSLMHDTHCTFEVYSGIYVNELTLLWKVSSEKDAQNGPSGIIRSTTEDGALTVLFNPNAFSTAECGRGFDAEVFEYTEQPMQLEDVIVKQMSDDNVKAGDKDVKILDVNVRTMGSADDYILDAVSIDLKGSEKNVERVTVYDKYFNKPLAEKAITSSDKNVTLKFGEEILKDGDNHYFICYDVNEKAEENAILDAAISSVTISGVESKVENGNPEGFIRLRNIYNISDGDAAEKIVSEETPLSFYDAGGFDGTCGSNFNGTVTFTPAEENDVIKLIFKSWDVAYGDKMSIYHGGAVKANPDYAFDMSDKNMPGREIISKSADGKITVNFVTKNNDSEGFEIEVRSCKREDLKIAEIKAESVFDESLFRGSEDVPVMKIKLTAEGNSNPFDITSFVFGNISENTVSALHIYATGADNAMYRTYPFGSGMNEIKGCYNISEPGEYNFFVTADIKTTPSVGDEVEINLLNVNGTDAEKKYYTVVKKGFSGTIKVGREEECKSLDDAINEISGGIDGPVTISIEPGVYSAESFVIPHVEGNSSKNTITITSSTGSRDDVQLLGTNFNKPVDYEDYYGVVTIDGADYVTLKNLDITTNDNQYPSVVRIKNNSCHVTVDSCYIHAEMVTGYKDNIVLVETYSKLEEGQNTDYLTVSNSVLEGARIGMRFAGASSIYLSDQRGNRFVNNTLRNQGMIGIYGVDISDVEIIGNTIINDKTDAGEFKAIDINLDNVLGNVNISANTVNVTASTKQSLLYLRNINATSANPVRIFNNQFSGVGGKQLSHAIVLNGKNIANVDFAYNTLMMNGNEASSLIYVPYSVGENVSFINNIFVNRQNETVFEFDEETSKTLKFRANVFSSVSKSIASVAGAYKTFSEFVALTGAEDCYEENVDFLGDDVLEPMEKGSLLNAKVIDYVTSDITGMKRNAVNPTIGAYEYVASDEAPAMKNGYPKLANVCASSADVIINTNISGKAYAIAVKDNVATPDVSTIKSEGKSHNIVRNTDNIITVKQLEKGAEYRIFVVVESARGIAGSICSTDKFVAEGESNAAPEELTIKSPDVNAESGVETVLTATITGGILPYSVQWKDNMNVVVKEETLSVEGETSVKAVSEECVDYLLTVTDAEGTMAQKKVRMIVMGEAVTATFENLYLKEESYWNGKDMSASFVNGSYKFSNSYEPDWNSWGGFSYSNVTETEFTGYLDNSGFASAVGCGYDESANYSVVNCFVPAYINVLNKADGDSIRGFYITNAACVYKSVNDGDGMSDKFTKGDYLMLTISDIVTDKKIDYYLADYRSENEADHYCLDSWQWVDLRSLGCVKNLKFSISGSQNNDYGLLTPGYFCMDNFNGFPVITEVPAQYIEGNGKTYIDLSPLFTFENNGASVKYSIEEQYNVDDSTNISIIDNNLVFSGASADNMKMIVKAVKKGKVEYISIPVSYTNAVNAAVYDADYDGYRYTIDGKRTDREMKGVNIIRNKEGNMIKVLNK